MKTQITRPSWKAVPGFTLAALLAVTNLNAQTAAPAPAPASAESAPQQLSAEDLNDLLGPIALYPDALIALILPASTVPSDITMAARYLKQNGDDANVDDQPWDESVKGLARYPDVLKWMDDNLEWTTSLGEAFVEQPADVMNSMQALRTEAKDKGNLVNTPQQTVVVEKQTREIRIVPTDPEVIYVPQYDPEVVYVQQYQPDYVTPLLTFGAGFAVGAWLNYDCDWGNDNIYYGNNVGWNNRNRWNDRGWNDGNVNVVNTTVNNTNINNITNNSNVNRWQPSAASQRQISRRQQQNIGNARIARANAQVRHPNGQNNPNRNGTAAQRAARVPKPTHLVASKNPGNHAPSKVAADRVAAAKGPGNAPKPDGKPNGNNNKPGNAANKPNANKPNHPKPVTAAPAVNGQNAKKPGANAGNNKPNANKPNAGNNKPNADKPNAGNNKPNTNKPNGGNPVKKPTAAPSTQGASKPSGGKPHKPSGNPQAAPNPQPRPNTQAQVKKPKPAPQQPKPQAQPRPQAQPKPQAQPRPQAQPKPHAQPKPQAQPRPQQPRPQAQPKPQAQAQPKPQGGGGGGNQSDDEKKKKKKKNN